jgi:flagellar biogenesis protein FliO
MLNTSLTLAGIVILGWLTVYVSRRWERTSPRGPLELLGSLRLEGKRSLYLVRIGERVVALGASEGGMVKVLEMAPGEWDGDSASRAGEVGKPLSKFASLLRFGAPNAPSSAPHTSADRGASITDATLADSTPTPSHQEQTP